MGLHGLLQGQLYLFYNLYIKYDQEKQTALVPNTSMSLQTTQAADAHLAKRTFLLKEQTLNIEESLRHRAGTGTPAVSKRDDKNLEPR
jgi:hypothetical protein